MKYLHNVCVLSLWSTCGVCNSSRDLHCSLPRRCPYSYVPQSCLETLAQRRGQASRASSYYGCRSAGYLQGGPTHQLLIQESVLNKNHGPQRRLFDGTSPPRSPRARRACQHTGAAVTRRRGALRLPLPRRGALHLPRPRRGALRLRLGGTSMSTPNWQLHSPISKFATVVSGHSSRTAAMQAS